VETYGTTGQATDDNMAQADTQGYRNAIILCKLLLFHCNACYQTSLNETFFLTLSPLFIHPL